MNSQDLEITDGAVAGAWIRPRLGGEFGAVTLQVPKGFEAYARVFHPAPDPEDNPVRWADVAETCGTIPHREMQWHAILGLPDTDELGNYRGSNNPTRANWTGFDPPTGAMDIQELDVLCRILAAHTADPTHCFFGLCTIQNWEDSFSADELQPLLELPAGRDHIVLAGPLSAIDQIEFDWNGPGSLWVTFVATGEGPPAEPDPPELLGQDAPNLIWAADHSWLVASEVDFDSTLVGGTTGLIAAIVKSPELEAWQIEPTDSLASDADKVNVAKKE